MSFVPTGVKNGQPARYWYTRFGQNYAYDLRRSRPRPDNWWHFDYFRLISPSSSTLEKELRRSNQIMSAAADD